MADFDLTVQAPEGAGGRTVTYKSGAQAQDPITDSDRFLFGNAGREYVLVKKGAGAVDVTVETPLTVDGLAVADRTVAVAANSDALLGPFEPRIYNNEEGKVALRFSSD